MAATVPVEQEGQTSPLLEQALAIGDLPDGREQPQTKSGVRIETDEKGRQREVAVIDPVGGSMERFMMSFGSPQRWAGR